MARGAQRGYLAARGRAHLIPALEHDAAEFNHLSVGGVIEFAGSCVAYVNSERRWVASLGPDDDLAPIIAHGAPGIDDLPASLMGLSSGPRFG